MLKKKKRLNGTSLESFGSAASALVLAFVLVALVVAATGIDPLNVFRAMARGSFGSAYYIKLTMRYAIPMLLVALSFTICDRCGYFNIGQEAQMGAAAISAVLVKYFFPDLPQWALLTLMILTGIIAAVILSVGPALLKYYFKVPEAIILVMLGFIIELLANFLFMNTALAYPDSASMPRSIEVGTPISTTALYICIVVIFVAYTLFMKKSVWGLRIKLVGQNPEFTNRVGISSVKTLTVASTIGGALAGLAGLFEILCVYGFMYYNFANGMAFLGISAALLGRQTPFGMLIGSVVFGA